MDIKQLDALQDTLYMMNKYPLFFLNAHYEIQKGPSSFLSLPPDFFQEIIQKLYHPDPNHLIFSLFSSKSCYALIPFQLEKIAYIVVGPILYILPKSHKEIVKIEVLSSLDKQKDLLEQAKQLPYVKDDLYYFLRLIIQLLFQQDIDIAELSRIMRIAAHQEHTLAFHSEKSEEREHHVEEYTYNDELRLLHYIKIGDSMSARIVGTKLVDGRFGHIGSDRDKRRRHGFISLATLISRSVIEVGVPIESAYVMNAMFVHRMEDCTDVTQLYTLYMDMILSFSKLVRSTLHQSYPLWVKQTLDYMQRHIHEKISLQDIASEVHMKDSYISVKFKQLTGSSIIETITKQKMDEAVFLLKTSSHSILDISVLLSYSSQEYFATLFKKTIGVSPSSYRNQS